ncbi:hypothetical protein KC19_VG179900 [Ceratodon purpureus]|uniref:Uncharacterized protein n=1 Tax=Ceratodon purpureus TaxID=3225 RepID=A0A8T0HRP0_CERPU|nr:hypothetical protein KC19_VG179900 [Ceratodon purpureus]
MAQESSLVHNFLSHALILLVLVIGGRCMRSMSQMTAGFTRKSAVFVRLDYVTVNAKLFSPYSAVTLSCPPKRGKR